MEFQPDIFSRNVEKGVIHPDGRIFSDLKFGMYLTTTVYEGWCGGCGRKASLVKGISE
jgi:hypothetical protein